MPTISGGPDVAAAFAELAEMLVSDPDIEKYLTTVCRHCVRLVGTDAAAVVYATCHGADLSGVAASDDRGRGLAHSALSAADDPWHETVRSGQLVTIGNLAVQAERWPAFTARALRAGFTTVTMIPVGPQAGRVGALALLGRTEPDAHGVLVALSLADTAAAGLDLCAELRRQETAITQLQSALVSRIVIEQAKGILAERWKVTPDEAFGVLRRQARTNQQALADLARAVISRTAELAGPGRIDDRGGSTVS
jgi:GAF domain-containing protein